MSANVMFSFANLKEDKRLSRRTRNKSSVCVVKHSRNGEPVEQEFAMRRIYLSTEDESNITKLEIQDILNSIQQLCRLRHEHLIPYVACLHDLNLNCICIVTELCPDGSLYKHVTNQEPGPLSESRVLDWFSQVLSGLNYLHSRDIIHGDVRAKNIMYWATRNICKLSDYRVMCQVAELPNINHISIDAARHLAPEFWIAGSQRQMSSYFNKTTDMFSLGCLLHFLCCREDAFSGDDFESISKSVWGKDYFVIPSTYREFIQQMLDKLLHVDSSIRPTAEDLCQFLQFRGGESTRLSSLAHIQEQPDACHIVECDPEDGGFHVDWAILPDCLLHSFNWLIMARMRQSRESKFPWNLFAPPMSLSEEIVGWNSVLMHAQLSRNKNDLELSLCLHSNTPDTLCLVGPVQVHLDLTVRVNGKMCQIQGHEISFLRRGRDKVFTAVVCKDFPWNALDTTYLPKMVIKLCRAPEKCTFWWEGLSPNKLQPHSNRFPTIDWATLKGCRNWCNMWEDLVKLDGILFLPPLCIPWSAISGCDSIAEEIEIYLVSHLKRIDNSLHYQAVLHPNTPETLNVHNCTITLQFSLEVMNKCTKTSEIIHSGPFSITPDRNETGMATRTYSVHWSLKLTKSQWDSFDERRTPRILVELRKDLEPFFFMGMAPIQWHSSQSYFHVDWNRVSATVPWNTVWTKIVNKTSGQSLYSPAIFLNSHSVVICVLFRNEEDLVEMYFMQHSALECNGGSQKFHVDAELTLSLCSSDEPTQQVLYLSDSYEVFYSDSATGTKPLLLTFPTVPKWTICNRSVLPRIRFRLSPFTD